MEDRFLGLVGSLNTKSPKMATGILFSAPTSEYRVAVVCGVQGGSSESRVTSRQA